jgi:hypothetical protein
VTLVIGICGVRNSGKNTVGNWLTEHKHFSQASFAAPLKEMAKIAFPQLTEEQLYGNSKHREESLGIRMRGLDPSTGEPLLQLFEHGEEYFLDKDGRRYPAELTPRVILQTLGTEWGRRLYQNIWTDACLHKIYQSDVERWCITDCRFQNEMEAIRDRGGILVRLDRGVAQAYVEEARGSLHPSESDLLALSADFFDFTIPNTGPLEELDELLEEFWEEVEKLLAER